MYIVMAPHEKRAEKKNEDGSVATSDTIGDVVAAKSPEKAAAAPAVAVKTEEPAAAPDAPKATPQASSQG